MVPLCGHYSKSDVIEISSPLLQLYFLGSTIVVLVEHVSAHVHPVAHYLRRHVLRQKVGDAPAPNRVRAHGLRAFSVRAVDAVRTRLAPEARCGRLVDDAAIRGPTQPALVARNERFPTVVVDAVDSTMFEVFPE